MINIKQLTSKEVKQLFRISDCELMHRREAGLIDYAKQGNAFLYSPTNLQFLKQHHLAHHVLNWHTNKHAIEVENFPSNNESIDSVTSLIQDILIPVENEFGRISITYGFVSPALNRFIQKHSPAGTYPSIDQHSACEHNRDSKPISKRPGAACDFKVKGYECNMLAITQFIVNELPFDKLYFYGKDRPVHVSSNLKPLRHLQIMNTSENGRRIPGKKAFAEKAKQLAMELYK